MNKGLYLITDDRLISHKKLIRLISSLFEQEYISMLQFRSKDLPYQQKLDQASTLAELCNQTDVIFLVNDDIKLAQTSGAQGVHLGQNDTPLIHARQQLGASAIIGITCHNSLEDARQAQSNGADYVAFGRFFPSSSKPNAPPATIETLRKAKLALSIPIVAIGGITPDNGGTLLTAGADILAVIQSVFGATHPILAANAFQPIFSSLKIKY